MNCRRVHLGFLEKEMATHSSILAWRIPWTEKPGWLQSMGSQRVRHDWARYCAIFQTFLHLILTESHKVSAIISPIIQVEKLRHRRRQITCSAEVQRAWTWTWRAAHHSPDPETKSVMALLDVGNQILGWLAFNKLGKWQHLGLLVSRIVPAKYPSAVPKHFGTRDWFHGRLFFHGPEVGGWFQDYFKYITFIVYFVPDLMPPLIW